MLFAYISSSIVNYFCVVLKSNLEEANISMRNNFTMNIIIDLRVNTVDMEKDRKWPSDFHFKEVHSSIHYLVYIRNIFLV